MRPRIAHGTLVRIPFGGRVVRGFVLGLSDDPPSTDLAALKGVVVDTPLVPPPLDDVLGDVARRYVVPRGRAFARAVPPRVRVPETPPHIPSEGPPPQLLTGYQGGANLLAAIRARGTGTWCVQILPGADRGALVAEMVAALPSGAAIVLVPEVRYGSQVLDRLTEYFPELARVDSGQTDGQRSQAWISMAEGGRVAGGGRSAVFTPAPDLALIVVDEEHHQTYKEDRAPRYDARWVAIDRARHQRALCVLMSASPSVEAGAAAASGTYASVSATRSEYRAARPVIELVGRPEDRSIGSDLHERISSTLRSGDRVALLAPSPAFSRAIWCGDCRRSMRCPRCESGLFFDKSLQRVRCARCGHVASAPDVCPTCGSAELKHVGAGTERLAEQLDRSFPRATVHRVDPAHPDRIPRTPIDIYVTTWMGTKAALRPAVALVGVLDADWLIRRPDFRSAESAYQALVEMAEWAGPATEGGRVVVQTAEPNHHALQAVVRADYDFFLRRELELRKELAYPPFVEIVKVSARGPGARAVLKDVTATIEGLATRVLGPVEVNTSDGATALQLLVKCLDARPIADALRVILESTPKGIRLSVDVDPR